MHTMNFINLKNKLLLSLPHWVLRSRRCRASMLPFALCHCRNSIKFISTFAGRRKTPSPGDDKTNCKRSLEGSALTIMIWPGMMLMMMKLVLFLEAVGEMVLHFGSGPIAFDVTDPNLVLYCSRRRKLFSFPGLHGLNGVFLGSPYCQFTFPLDPRRVLRAHSIASFSVAVAAIVILIHPSFA